MKVYAAEVNYCTLESSYGVLSLHAIREDAADVAQVWLTEQERAYWATIESLKKAHPDRSQYDCEFPDWVQSRVTEYGVI